MRRGKILYNTGKKNKQEGRWEANAGCMSELGLFWPVDFSKKNKNIKAQFNGAGALELYKERVERG